MQYIARFLQLFFLIFVISCSNSKKEDEKSESEIKLEKENAQAAKEKIIDEKNEREDSLLKLKYNAIEGWDGVSRFTYQLQELFNVKGKLVAFTGSIIDITRKNDSYILKFTKDSFDDYKVGKFFVEISVSPDKFQELQKIIGNERIFINGCFIFKCNRVTSSSMLEIDSEVDNIESLEEATSYVTYNFRKILILFKGELVDYYIHE